MKKKKDVIKIEREVWEVLHLRQKKNRIIEKYRKLMKDQQRLKEIQDILSKK